MNALAHWINWLKEKDLLSTEDLKTSVLLLNIRRLYYVSIFGILLSFFQVMYFLFFVFPQSSQELLWKNGIIASHCILLAGMAAFLLFFKKTKKSSHKTRMLMIIHYLFTVFIFIIGILIVSIDQLVTSNITPFMIACAVVGMIFVVSPVYTTLLFMGAFGVFAAIMSAIPSNSTVLASNLANGIAAVMIGLCVSYILWFSSIQNLRQKQRIKEQQKQLEINNQILAYVASYDSLTGVYNRREFHQQIEKIANECKSNHVLTSLILLDIDWFKKVNDRYGHPAGDKVIVQFAKLLSHHMEKNDLLARWGGEEFIILKPHSNMEQTKDFVEDLKQDIEQTLFSIGENQITITASFGIAPFPWDKSFNSAYNKADKALYQAKKMGRNRIEIHT